MGYMHIDNLYKNQTILQFKECFVLEKIHGTSAHISYSGGNLTFFSGGESHVKFTELFNADELLAKFQSKYTDTDTVIIYGEAYGGKQQKMSATYGTELKFVAFDVTIGSKFLPVPYAAALVQSFGLEFVDYHLSSTDIPMLDTYRDAPSTQALRNGITEPQQREGVVLRPVQEWTDYRGNRVIAKHKHPNFGERNSTSAVIDPAKQALLTAADAIATEWCTPMRLEHVIDHMLAERDDKTADIKDTPEVIRRMVEDVLREAAGEIVDSKDARKAISQHTARLFKSRVQVIG